MSVVQTILVLCSFLAFLPIRKYRDVVNPQIISLLLTFPSLEDLVPHSSVTVSFTFFVSKQIVNCCCSWQVFSLFGGCVCYCICINHLYLLRILLGCVSGMSSEEFIKTPCQVINSSFNVCVINCTKEMMFLAQGR